MSRGDGDCPGELGELVDGRAAIEDRELARLALALLVTVKAGGNDGGYPRRARELQPRGGELAASFLTVSASRATGAG